jgi:hypothetical protein
MKLAGSKAALQLLGIEKVAYGLAEARKVLSLAKARQLPAAAMKPLTPFGKVPNTLVALGLNSENAANIPKSFKPLFERGSIVQTAPSAKILREGLKNVPLTPEQNILLESIAKGHELDELKAAVSPSSSFWKSNFSHMSPDVLLQEHNRLVTLPPEHREALSDVMRQTRSRVGDADTLSNYIDYGKSERLSRHARKRILQQIDTKQPVIDERLKALNAAYAQDMQQSAPYIDTMKQMAEGNYEAMPNNLRALAAVRKQLNTEYGPARTMAQRY